MRFLLDLAWRDLRGGGRSLWVFCACLVLGVTLVAAGGGLFRQVGDSLQADARALFGGDVEVQHDRPLQDDELAWLRARGEVSLLVELRSMLLTADERAQLVELQSFDEHYPLYGSVEMSPPAPLRDALAERDGRWGIAIDRALAQRLGLKPGDEVTLGETTLAVRAITLRQPDRSLRADWSGLPVLLSADALAATGLIQPGSRVEYNYRIKTDTPPEAFRDQLVAAFPQGDWDVRTFSQRSERVAEVLAQIGSGLLLIGFSALFIGGLGVFNSVQAYLQGKLGTLATLRALGLRDGRLAALYLLQLLMLAALASLVGALLGGVLALAGAAMAADRLPLAPALIGLVAPLSLAWLFGVLTALTFALPALGRALSVSPAALFRGLDGAVTRTSRGWWWLTALAGLCVATLLVLAMPDRRFGAGFVVATLLVLGLLELLVRVLQSASRALMRTRLVEDFTWRLALASLHRPGAPLRAALLSLGSALTLLVASTLVVAALLRTVNETVPERAPALVFYDVQNAQQDIVRDELARSPSLQQLQLAPLVLGRIQAVNGVALRDSGDAGRALEARDEQKLSTRAGNFDDVIIARGAWWPDDYRGPPLVAMEDREADELGLQVGDTLRFDILGTPVEAKLAAIYSQRRYQARLWLEAMFSDGVLDPFITRHVGAAYLDAQEAMAAQDRIAALAPNIVSVRTAGMLDEARTLLARASAGLAVVAGVSLIASLLVLASVMAASRSRQVYEASLLNAIGARIATIRRALQAEYALLAVLTSLFAILVGSALAFVLLHFRLQLDMTGLLWAGAATAVLVSSASLGLGAAWLLRQLRVSPARLLRAGG
ncbi:ABC transporter permease [Uliginosibacterium sp. H1]|uniref:ABC transporter permease n=1 Tax=Uliginosibacterium sp. H1 TaxID=3114757 RepID=UPI002E185D38|nr:FtsX-like permease family protein [Uliginosibacterium sp. H1]